MDFGLGESIDMLRDSVRAFAQEKIAPHAARFDRDNAFPRSLWSELGALGLLGVTVEESYGGAGLGYLAHVVAMEEISRASAAVGLSFAAHSNLCVNQIRRFGTSEQKRVFLPKLVSGEWVGALAMSEAAAGSDVLAMRMRATRDGEHYVLDGSKMWVTNGPDADVIVVYAKTGPVEDRRSVTAFVVEGSVSGLSRGAKFDKLGMRGSDTCELHLENCRVGADAVLGAVGAGVEVLMSGLDIERVVLAGGPLGIMQAGLDVVLPYVRERRQFGRPIGEFELMQGKLADLETALSASRAYVYAVARCADAGRLARKDAAGAILFAAERATGSALQAVQALGGMGYVREMPVERLLRDAKLYEIGAGTSEIRRMLIGRELLQGAS